MKTDDSGECAVLAPPRRAASCGDFPLSHLGEKLSPLADGLHRTRLGRPLDHCQRWTAGGKPIGNVCAIATAFGFAGASVAMRRGHVRDFSPAIFGYGLLACAFSALVCLGQGVSLASPLADVVAALAERPAANGTGLCLLPARRATRSRQQRRRCLRRPRRSSVPSGFGSRSARHQHPRARSAVRSSSPLWSPWPRPVRGRLLSREVRPPC